MLCRCIPLSGNIAAFFFLKKNTVAMAILRDIIWSSSRILSIEWLLTFLPPPWSETLYPKRKTNLDTLSSRKTKILWGYCYPMGRNCFCLENNGLHKMVIIHERNTRCLPLMVLASLLCMVTQRLCTHPPTPPLSQFCSPKCTHRLECSCVPESSSLSLFSSSFKLEPRCRQA